MIRIRFRGQLGNQMFQYATARALAERCRTTVNVDVTEYIHPADWSKYQLWHFRRLQLGSLIPQFSRNLLFSLQRPARLTPIIYERNGLGFDSNVNSLTDQTVLSGYFTSERYFIDYRDLIVSLFNISDFLRNSDTTALKLKFPDRPPTSLHVRRGDYVGDPLFDIGDLDCYYRKCVEIILNFTPDAYFVVFSDDPQWCAEWPLLKEIDAVVINARGLPHHDMALMSWCQHHIITNSTYSWWSAWLNCNPAKRVLMPRQWLNRWSSEDCGVTVPGWTEIDP
jgi:Glycosyl transferase family 11